MKGSDRTDRNDVLVERLYKLDRKISRKKLHTILEEKGIKVHYYTVLGWFNQEETEKEITAHMIVQLEPIVEQLMKDYKLTLNLCTGQLKSDVEMV